MNELNELLETVSKILGRCALMGFALLFLWSGLFFWGRHFIFSQAEWFGLTPHECSLVAYGGMGFAKILIILFFVFPWAAIRLVLRKRRG